MLSLKTHNVLDYVIGAVLVLCPFVFGFNGVPAARNVFLILGFGLIGYSLITNYQYSIAKILPVRTHMVFDVLAGLVLLLAPAIFGYGNALTGGQVALHYVMGIGAVLFVAVTRDRGGLGTRRGRFDEQDERPHLKRVA